jgi:hypothetical protein
MNRRQHSRLSHPRDLPRSCDSVVPEERLKVARHLSAGKKVATRARPVGTLERIFHDGFNCPSGTGPHFPPIPGTQVPGNFQRSPWGPRPKLTFASVAFLKTSVGKSQKRNSVKPHQASRLSHPARVAIFQPRVGAATNVARLPWVASPGKPTLKGLKQTLAARLDSTLSGLGPSPLSQGRRWCANPGLNDRNPFRIAKCCGSGATHFHRSPVYLCV